MIESVLEPLFHISSLPKTWSIAEVGTNFVISNNNLEAESISLYESVCDADRLDFGRCSSARFSFTTLDIDLELSGRVFDVSFTFEDEPEIPFVVGRFRVVEDKPSPDRRNRDVVMYDALYDVLNTNYANWYNAITDNQWESMTLGDFADSFFAHIGIEVETESRAVLVNADMPVSKTVQTNELLGSVILYAICQAAGCLGNMTRRNKFRYLYLKPDIEGLFPANDLYPSDDLYPIEPVTTRIDETEYYPPLVYETYKAPSITKLYISESENSEGTVIGSGDVEYDIIGNFLLFGKSSSDLSTYGANILGVITKRSYTPYSVSKVGNLCFELGDPIRMNNDRMSVESYVLTRTFRGTMGFVDDISAEGAENYTQMAKTANVTYQQLQSKTLVLEKSVDGLSSRLTYELDDTIQGSYAYQTAQEIGLKVSDSNLLNSLDSKISSVSITANGFNFQSTGSIVINTSNFTLDAQGNATFSGTLASGMSISAPVITGGSITGNSITGSTISGGTITGGTISGATLTGGSLTGAQISGGSITIADENNDDMIVIYNGKLSVLDNQRDYRFECQHNLIRFFQGSNIRGIIDGGSYSDTFQITGRSKLLLDGNDEATVSAPTTTISGSSYVHLDGDNITQISGGSFKRIQFHSYLGSETTINLKDDILDEIASIKTTLSNHETRITALENA